MLKNPFKLKNYKKFFKFGIFRILNFKCVIEKLESKCFDILNFKCIQKLIEF